MFLSGVTMLVRGLEPGPLNLNVIGVLNGDAAGDNAVRISRIAVCTRHLLQICVTFGVLETTSTNIYIYHISAVLPKKGNGILKILPQDHVFYVTYRGETVRSMYTFRMLSTGT